MNNQLPLLFFGDSITFGQGTPAHSRWTSLLLKRLSLPETGIENAGVCGDTTTDALARIDSDVLQHQPKVVTVCFGFNDARTRCLDEGVRTPLAQFKENYRLLLEKIVDAGSTPAVIVPHQMNRISMTQADGSKHEIAYRHYETVVRELAVQMNCALINIPMMVQWLELDPGVLVAEDGLHLSQFGNVLYAKLLLGPLKKVLAEIR